MAFCNNCGKQNNETVKFCIGCGKPINISVQAQQSNPVVSYPQHPEPKKFNKPLFLILGIAVFLGLGTLVFFLVIKSEDASNKDLMENANQKSNNSSNETYQVETISEIPASQTSVTTQTSETVTAEQHVRNYFEITTTKVFDNIYPYLTNCIRYYNNYNPTRESIYKDAIGYWGKITNITQTINYVTVEDIENGKNVLVNMNYSFFSIKYQEQKYISNLSVRVRLDNNNNIIEIYELSRDK